MRPALMLSVAALALAVPAIAQRTMPTTSVAVDPAVAKARDAALKDDVAWDVLEGLTTEVGPRLAATEAEARARAWAVVKLKALGFKNVHIETYTMPVWVRGVETAEVVGPYPQKLTLAALGRSGATPPEGITAPVVYFPTFNDLLAAPDGSLTGKIAFVSNQMKAAQDGSGYGAFGAARFIGPNVAAKKGAAAIVIRSIGSDKGRWPHTGGTNWTPGVTPIPAAALSVADAEQLERIFKRTDKVTLKLVLTPKTMPDAESGNVVAEVPGTDPSAGVIVIGGHLDSWDIGTGAIDDGAGVAITTAAAKRLLDGPRPRRTIRVVWFGAEEPGGYGGEAYAKAHANEKFALASESDFGADNVWRFNVNLPDSAKAVGDRLGAALAPLGIVRGKDPAGGGTDVEPILKFGWPSITLGQDGTRYFDWHHTPEDTLDKIDRDQLRQNVAVWTTMLWIVANAPENWEKVTPKGG
ncbi:MAG: M20/M25/M40 family metallo-hydrolase [Sphingomonas sp.]|uniref:M20/M25/M40 family metallo-hydrolase n=1 Tax=Sphingomonas sp. TaxID=28214 RepID=UPI001ACFBB67|nr:M20/M25/M40 family metallo-hydrolase [Sphingomonas sp.]MBN8814722.1 M20/M25/M40 family metallo-hydrolase [Sphingomonas sp.]